MYKPKIAFCIIEYAPQYAEYCRVLQQRFGGTLYTDSMRLLEEYSSAYALPVVHHHNLDFIENALEGDKVEAVIWFCLYEVSNLKNKKKFKHYNVGHGAGEKKGPLQLDYNSVDINFIPGQRYKDYLGGRVSENRFEIVGDLK